MTLREPPKARRTAGIIGRFVGLIVLLALFALVVWTAATNQQATAIQRSQPSLHAPGEHVSVPGGFVHVSTVGQDDIESVLIHHDTVAGGLTLLPLANELAATGREVRVLDLVGFGFSSRPEEPGRRLSTTGQAETLAAFLDDLALRQVEIVGFGWGGEVATELTVIRPDLVGRLVLVDTADLPVPGSGWRTLEGMPFGVGEAVSFTFSGASFRAQDRFVEECPSWAECRDPELYEMYQHAASIPGTARGIWARRASAPALVAPDRLDEITVPVLMVAVDLSRTQVESLAEDFPAAEVAVVTSNRLVEALTG